MPATKPVSGSLDINIEDNADYVLPVIYKINGAAVNVTGYTATFTMLDAEGETKTPLLELTEANNGVAIGTTDGTFTVKIDATQATFGYRKMVYDLVVVSPTLVPTRLIHGSCQSYPRVKQA